MESREHLQIDPGANNGKRRKVFMACTQCRDRKTACDGKSPECSGCVSRGLHCEYVAVRKMRGPGKKSTQNADGRANLSDAQIRSTGLLDDSEKYLIKNDSLSTVPKALRETEARAGVSGGSIGLEDRLRQIYPVFLHPENSVGSMQELKRAVQDDQKSPEGFSSLVSQDMVRYMLENTYDEIMKVCPIFDLSALQRLNAEQQAVSRTHPVGNPARWAILSTWIAIAMRFRTVFEAKDKFDHLIKSYYRNAVLVLPDLILQPANMETIQALLLMAVYADDTADRLSFVMLVTNATRQIELLAPLLSSMSDRREIDPCQRLLSFAQLQERKIAEKYGLTVMLKSVSD